jgi:hypothetical protein
MTRSTAPTKARACLLGASGALALALAGCGQSSNETSNKSSTATVAKPPAATSTAQQPAVASSGATARTVSGSAGGVSARMRAGTHHPKVGRPWPIRFTVTAAGHPLKAAVSYEYLFAGQVVAHRSHYTFTGHFSDTFLWPSSAVGYPLTFRATIVAKGATIKLDYPVQVSR